jgi:hypothetical protein
MFEDNYSEHEKVADRVKNPDDSKVLKEVMGLFQQRPIIDKQEILRLRGKIVGSGIGLQTPYSKYRRELLKVCDDDITKNDSFYKLKDMSKTNVKPVDWWI